MYKPKNQEPNEINFVLKQTQTVALATDRSIFVVCSNKLFLFLLALSLLQSIK